MTAVIRFDAGNQKHVGASLERHRGGLGRRADLFNSLHVQGVGQDQALEPETPAQQTC